MTFYHFTFYRHSFYSDKWSEISVLSDDRLQLRVVHLMLMSRTPNCRECKVGVCGIFWSRSRSERIRDEYDTYGATRAAICPNNSNNSRPCVGMAAFARCTPQKQTPRPYTRQFRHLEIFNVL